MPSRHRQAGTTLIWLILWLVGMAAIAYWCVARHAPALQQLIANNAQAALLSANASDIEVTVDGRTATLAGIVPSDVRKEQLINVVADADGVRSVNDQLTVAENNETNAVSAPVPTAQEDKIIVEGAVAGLVDTDNKTNETQPEQESTGTTNAESIEPNPPTDSVINEADEQPRVLDTSVEAAAELLSNTTNGTNEATDADGPKLEVAELVINPDIPAIEETEPSADEDTIDSRALALIEQARKETANALIDPQTPKPDNATAQQKEQQTQASNSLSEAQRSAAVTELPSLKMQIDDGTLTLTGEISNDDSLLEFIRTAMSTFDANYVINSVQVNDNTAKADWLTALNGFLPAMRSVSNAGIDIIESQITLSGEAANDTQHDQVIDKALAELNELSLVERISVSNQEPSGSDSQNNVASSSTKTPTDENPGTPIEPQVQRKALKEAYEALNTDKILFESGSDVLTEDSLRVIETIAAVFAKYPSVNIEVDGHTDASGISANNLKLSQLRANAVRDYLVKQGIAAERLSAYGFGDGVPIADNSTAAGRRLNRRIEFNF